MKPIRPFRPGHRSLNLSSHLQDKAARGNRRLRAPRLPDGLPSWLCIRSYSPFSEEPIPVYFFYLVLVTTGKNQFSLSRHCMCHQQVTLGSGVIAINLDQHIHHAMSRLCSAGPRSILLGKLAQGGCPLPTPQDRAIKHSVLSETPHPFIIAS